MGHCPILSSYIQFSTLLDGFSSSCPSFQMDAQTPTSGAPGHPGNQPDCWDLALKDCPLGRVSCFKKLHFHWSWPQKETQLSPSLPSALSALFKAGSHSPNNQVGAPGTSVCLPTSEIGQKGCRCLGTEAFCGQPLPQSRFQHLLPQPTFLLTLFRPGLLCEGD